MILGKRNEREPDVRDAKRALERARQLQAGLEQAGTAAKSHDAKTAESAIEAGRRLTEATAALAGALASRAQAEARPGGLPTQVQKEAEALLNRAVEILHRLHFQIIRFDLEETDPAELPVEEADRTAVEIGQLAERIGGGSD